MCKRTASQGQSARTVDRIFWSRFPVKAEPYAPRAMPDAGSADGGTPRRSRHSPGGNAPVGPFAAQGNWKILNYQEAPSMTRSQEGSLVALLTLSLYFFISFFVKLIPLS